MTSAGRFLIAVVIVCAGPALPAQTTAVPVALANRFSISDGSRIDEPSSADAERQVLATVAAAQDVRDTRAPWWAPAASLLLPGAGQFAMGQQRSVAYLVADAYLVLQSLAARRDGDRDRDEYRAIAADVARRPFSSERPVGPWAYYEVLSERLESGRYDRIPGGAIDPETDEATYNGASWRLARENHWTNPDSTPALSSPQYQRALAFYEGRAIRDEFRWSWRDAQLQRDVYNQTIASANRSYQRSVNLFSLVGANHLTSMIDAYVTVRVRRYGGVRVAGLSVDGVASSVQPIGDPAAGRYRVSTAVRLVPSTR